MSTKNIIEIVVVAAIVVGGGAYLYLHGAPKQAAETSANNFGAYHYECDEHVTFAMTPASDMSSVHVTADNGGAYPPDSTLVKTATANRFEGNGVVLVGNGETVTLNPGSESAINCSPVPDNNNAPFNWGDAPQTPAASANSNVYVAGNLLLGTDGSADSGKYLIGYNGMTLYIYANDKNNVSNCTGACATNWPPYVITDTSVLANLQAGVSGHAGTITRADGTMQVTYNGKPLYFYKNDTKSGDTSGQNVGGVWFLVAP